MKENEVNEEGKKEIASAGIEFERSEIDLNQTINKKPAFEDRPKYILLEKTKAMYTLMHPYLELFPKSEKFTLGAKIENTLLDAIKLLILQNYQQTNEERRKIILELLATLYILEVLLQQSATFKYLSYEAFDRSMLLLREINSFALARYKNLGGNHENI